MEAIEVPQTLEYRGGQLNVVPVLEVENFTNWKKRFLCHIIGIEPQFENIIKNGPFIPMTAGQRKPKNQWTGDERRLILPAESQRNTTDPSVAFTDSSTTDYDSVDESSVCSTPLPLLKKLEAPAKGNKSSSALKVHSAPAGKLKSVKIKDDPSLAIQSSKVWVERLQDLTSQDHQNAYFHLAFTVDYLFRKRDQSKKSLTYLQKIMTSGAISVTRTVDATRESILGQLQTTTSSSINKCLLLLHWTLFDPVILRSINHEKYTLVIVDEYSRYTWVYFLMKKSQAPETIMSFIKRVENKNDIKVKQLRIDNGTEFRNSILVNFWDEKWISQNFSSPYTPEQLELWRGHLEPL
ncbi:retrovirus-related pol polyprotein from transposon TNT 1-94 [Tanacetum coccineum]